ncbi:alpha/beta hydrolase [Pseudobacter ginsenosidimutans]|nr:alpha/beta hydrolase [Pseudobacter ginsenosidimutans]
MKEAIINGVSISVQEFKTGSTLPTIIFLHDSLGCISLWRSFPQELGQLAQCNVLVYDRQGYGASAAFNSEKRQNDYLEIEADNLVKLMDACRIDKAILFGHSDGGSIALIAAAKYPERCTAVITEGAHIFVEEITLAGIRNAVTDWQTTSLKQKLEKYHGNKTESVFHAWTDTWLNPQFRSWNIEHFLPRIQCPVLVIQGENDEFGSIAQVEGILSGVSGKVKKWMAPELGHTPHKESKATVLQQAAGFLREVVL